MLNLLPPGMDPVRAIGKGIGRDKPYLRMAVGPPGNLVNRTVPHAVAEDLRGLTVPAAASSISERSVASRSVLSFWSGSAFSYCA